MLLYLEIIASANRCRRHFKWGRGLTVHHITPRAKGGNDDLSNLVALCTRCHDIVEIAGYRTIGEITTIDARPVVDDRGYSADWRAVVYGSGRRIEFNTENDCAVTQTNKHLSIPPHPWLLESVILG